MAARQRSHPAANITECFFRVYGNELPDQCAGPIVKSHMAADTGTGQMNLSAISKGSVNMVVAGDERGIFPAFDAI